MDHNCVNENRSETKSHTDIDFDSISDRTFDHFWNKHRFKSVPKRSRKSFE